MVLPRDADNDLIEEDIAEFGTSNPVILEKIKRANEDATGQMRSLFLNNVDLTNLPDFYVQITSEYATSLYWVKSTGTSQAIDQAKDVYKKAERMLAQRFFPVESRA